MKKLKLFALGLIGSGLLLTSCADDDDESIPPILSVTETTVGANSSNEITVEPGTTLRFEFEARRGDADLQDFEFLIDGVSAVVTTEGGEILPFENIPGSQNSIYTDAINVDTKSTSATTVYRFVVTDEDGLTASKSITVITAPSTTDLEAAEDFTWIRIGSTPGSGLAQFGLQWTSNTSTNAIVTVNSSTTKMVSLNSADWTQITTVEGLTAAINNNASISQYTGVSVTQDGTYDDVLGVMFDGDVFLLQVTSGDVETGTAGTTVTIEGEYRTNP